MTARRRAHDALVLGVTLALTGCTTATTPALPPTPDPTPVAEAPAETPVAAAPVVQEPTAPAVGATISTEEEVAAAKAAGLGVFTTATGERLVIDPAAPAPAVMVEEFRATGNDTAAADWNAAEAEFAALREAGDRALAAGKNVVYVFQGGRYGGMDGGNALASVIYMVRMNDTSLNYPPKQQADTREGAIAIAEALIAAQPNPAEYELIDLTS